ncbi:MAG: LysR family transcriptional regulator [Eubacterium sp.]|nr:LysR family transcriptional regulator [Eubacterium sp.]
MQLNQLFCFMEAVKYHSISVAAEQNYISQSSFSSSISRLEKELGVSLLKRTNTGITVTEYGNYVLDQAKLIFEAQDNIIRASDSSQLTGTVSVGCIPGPLSSILPEAVIQIQEKNPGLILSFNIGESRDIAKDVSSGYANLGIVVCGVYLKNYKDIKYTPLFQDEYLLYVGRQSSLWEKSSVALKELRKQKLIAYGDEFKKDNGGITELFQKKDYPDVNLVSDNPDFIKTMVSRSDYSTFFPKHMMENDIYVKNGLIKGLPVSDYDLTFELGYIESTSYRSSLKEERVMDILKSALYSYGKMS